MTETPKELSDQEQHDALLQQLMQNINPADYMTSSVREIANLSMDTLKLEYDLVLQKQSDRSSKQRRLIVERYEFELTKLSNEQQDTTSNN